MPVKSINEKEKQNVKVDTIAKRFGYDYTNWNWMSLMRLDFWATIITLFSLIFLILGVIFSCTSGEILRQYTQAGNRSAVSTNAQFNGEWGFAIFCWVMVVCTWVAICIMNYYILIKARDIDVLTKTWWWGIFNFLPWIFIYVSYFVWKKELDKDQDQKILEPDGRTVTFDEEELEEEIITEGEVQERREEENKQYQSERKEHKTINTSGKPLMGNKKRRR